MGWNCASRKGLGRWRIILRGTGRGRVVLADPNVGMTDDGLRHLGMQPHDVSLASPPQPEPFPPGLARRLLWPDWERRKVMLRREAWLVALAAYPLLAF